MTGAWAGGTHLRFSPAIQLSPSRISEGENIYTLPMPMVVFCSHLGPDGDGDVNKPYWTSTPVAIPSQCPYQCQY
jgi:hypothetical protein